MTGKTTYWIGTEDQQYEERMKACRERREQWGDDDCDRDGSCSECEHDMADALSVSREEFIAAVNNGEVYLDDPEVYDRAVAEGVTVRAELLKTTEDRP